MTILDERLVAFAQAVGDEFDARPRVFNATAYRARCDGAASDWTNPATVTGTDDTAAINAAIAAAALVGGGEIFIPAHCVCSGQIDLNGAHNITFAGPGGHGAGYTQPCPGQLIYTGSGSTSFIKAGSTNAFTIRNLGIRYTSSSFTGDLIDFTHASGADSAYARIERCLIGGIDAHAAASLINLGGAIICEISGNHFQFGAVGIRGRREISVGNILYSNVHQIKGNTFDNLTTSALLNAGDKWTIKENTFEGTDGGTGGLTRAYYDDISAASAAIIYAMTFDDNWVGDSLAITDAIFTNNHSSMRGLSMRGNWFAPNAGVPALKFSGSLLGASITGNYTEDHIDFGSVAHQGVFVTGNTYGTEIVNLLTNLPDIFIVGNVCLADYAKTYIEISNPQIMQLGTGGGTANYAVLKGLSEVDVSGSQVLSSRYAGTPAAATDPATTMALVNFLRDALLSHHGAIG